MDPWQPISSHGSEGDLANKTANDSLTALFSPFYERKAMDSTQYLSIIGKITGVTIAAISDGVWQLLSRWCWSGKIHGP